MKQKYDAAALRATLDDIRLAKRSYGGKGDGSTTFTKISVSLPEGLVAKLDALDGPRSHHVERALKLYFQVLRSSADYADGRR